ncbi:hypothetical protein K439DRAFT_560871 [Ramaria rubella]|nr:hypothetical protein K439DRAFT_560871 [Ramaria rubella]
MLFRRLEPSLTMADDLEDSCSKCCQRYRDWFESTGSYAPAAHSCVHSPCPRASMPRTRRHSPTAISTSRLPRGKATRSPRCRTTACPVPRAHAPTRPYILFRQPRHHPTTLLTHRWKRHHCRPPPHSASLPLGPHHRLPHNRCHPPPPCPPRRPRPSPHTSPKPTTSAAPSTPRAPSPPSSPPPPVMHSTTLGSPPAQASSTPGSKLRL